MPTAEISTRFLRPSRHGDRLTLQLDCQRLGRSSLGFSVTARCGEEARFSCQATLVYVNDQGKPTPWPEALRGLLAERTKGA